MWEIKLPAAPHTLQLPWEGDGTAGMPSCPTEPVRGAVLSQDPAATLHPLLPITLLLPTELLLELPCLALAVLHQLSSLPQQKHQIQVTLEIISSRKEFIWVWVRKSVSCWLPDPLSCPDLFTEIAQPAKYLTPGIRGSLNCKKDLRRWDRKRKTFWEFVPSLGDLLLTG